MARILLPVLLLLSSTGAALCAEHDLSAQQVSERLSQLEAENARLHSEIVDLAARIDAGLNQPRPQTLNDSESGWWCDPYTLDRLAWRKGEYQIVPYGIGWLNLAYDTSRTATGPYTLFVESEATEGEPSFSVNARASRLGVNVIGPEILGVESGGRVEFDFFGVAQSENRAGILLRHAFGELKTDEWRIVGGQTTDVIAPLIPNVLNYTVAWGAGNIGYRRAQFRLERFVPIGAADLLTLQASINQTIVTDFATDSPQGGEDAGWPTVMGRVAVRLSDPPGPEIGISGHIGQEQVDFTTTPVRVDQQFTSWSFNVDVYAPVTDRFGFQGEFFTGDVLGTFQGGIIQGIDPVLRRGIRSLGGWGEVWCQLTDELHAHVGFGIDDPDDGDLSPGRRSQNQFYFANAVYDVTSLFSVGLEVSRWETRFVGQSRGQAVRIESVMKYRF